MEYRLDPVSGWYVWLSGTAFCPFGILIFLDRDQRANSLLFVAFGILWQLPLASPVMMDFKPAWAIFLIALNDPLPLIVLSVVLLRFPERRLQKRHERIFITVMATWILSFQAVRVVTWMLGHP